MDPEFDGMDVVMDAEPEGNYPLSDLPELGTDEDEFPHYPSDLGAEELSDTQLLDELERRVQSNMDPEVWPSPDGEDSSYHEVPYDLQGAVHGMVSEGLKGEGQQYLQSMLGRVDPQEAWAMTQHPLTRDLLLRAARDFERERSYSKPPRFESSYSEGGGMSAEERREVARFEREFGVKADRALIAEARRMRSRGY